tara:strand:+ start:12609 stop:18038 length:5430 start_codon:yes stop_codon:yes gene_type:complete
MAKDFRADQIRFHTILASGTMWPRQTSDTPPNPGYLDGNGHPHLGMVIMSASDAYDYEGTFNQSGRDMFNQFGHEPWLVFSGVANTTTNGRDGWDRPDVAGGYPKGSAVLFMGDVIISGTLFGKRQVITVDKDVPGDFHVIGDAFVSGGIFAGETKYPDSTTPLEDAFVVQQGDANNPPRISFRKIKWSTRLASSWTDTYKDCFLVFSGAKDGKDGNAGSIALFEGDVHISGNITGDGSGFYAPDENLILNNSASWYNQTNTWWGEVGTDRGPAFGHATTGTYARISNDGGSSWIDAGTGPSTRPYYIEQDRWSISGSADSSISFGGVNRAVPSHWYSDFINSSSVDTGAKKGGFRFLVGGDGLHAAAPGGFAAANRSVFTISGSGDIALDPYKSLVFDSQANSALTITHIKGPTLADPQTNHALRFTAATTYPVHYNFVRGEVTGSGGFHLPNLQNAHSANTRDGQQGQLSGITFQGEADSTANPAVEDTRPDVAIFYQKAANSHPQHPQIKPKTFIITASHTDSSVWIGAGNDLMLKADDDTFVQAHDDVWVIAGSDPNESNGEVKMMSRAGSFIFGNRGGLADTVSTENIFQITHNSADPTDTAKEGGYTVQLNSSGSTVGGDPSTASYLMFSGSGDKGAHTIKTVDQSGVGSELGHLTIFPDGRLIMSGTKHVSIDSAGAAGSDSKIRIATKNNAQSVEIGGETGAGDVKKMYFRAQELYVETEDKSYSGGGEQHGIKMLSSTTLQMTGSTNAGITATSGQAHINAKSANGIIHLRADSTAEGVQIARQLTDGTTAANIPVFIGGSTSTVTIGNDLSVGTVAHSGSVDVWGDLTVHGNFIKGHVITASMEDPLLMLNSGSKVGGSGGGIAIASGSSAVFTNAQGNWNYSMVFGRDTVNHGGDRDTFLAGRMDTEDGLKISLDGAVPIDMRAAGYRTVAGMTMTASQVPGESIYTVRAGNTGSAGRLVLHAGTTDGGANLGPFSLSGSYFTFSPGSKIYLDNTANDVYFRSQQGGTNQRLDLNLKNALRLTGQPNIQFYASEFQIRHGHSSADPTDVLMLKADAHPLVFSGSDYSFDMASGEYMWWNEHATDYTRWNIASNQVQLDMGSAMTGFKILGATKKIFFNSDSKYIKGDGQVSSGDLTYSSAQTATVKTTGYAQSVEIFAADANELLATKNNRGTGAVLIFTSSATGAPDKGYASLGYSTEELDSGMFTDKNEDVTLIFSGSAGNLPLKHHRGTSLFTGDVVISGSMAVGEYIYHDGNESAVSGAPRTAIRLQDRVISLIASGTNILEVEGIGDKFATFNGNSGQVSTQIKGYSAGDDKPIMLALAHDSSNRATFFNPLTTLDPDVDPANGHDVLLFFSGAMGSKYQAGDTDAAVRATALFGGDVYVSGTLGAGTVDLANLTLTDTNPYLRFYDANTYIKKDGTNLNFYDAALGTVKSLTQLASLSVSDDLFSVTRTALNVPNYGMSTGSFSFDSGFNGYSDNNPRPTNLVSDNNTGAGNTDVYFFVSGAVGMKARAPADIANQLNRRSVALFGGDVHISGTLTSNNTSFGASSLDKCYDTNAAGEEEAGGGRRIIADAEKVEIQRTTTNAIASHHLFGVTGSANFGQIKIAPIVDADGFYTYGGVFVTGSAGRLGFGVGGSTATDVAFSVNSNNNIEIGGTGGNSRKLYWDPNENSTFIRYTNTNSSNPGPKILHFANRTADGRISFSMGSGGTITGTNQGTGFEGHIAVSGSILPGYDNEYNLGSPSTRWANLYTGDLHLRNERGDWTIYEERDMLVVVNNITGKRYKMGLTPLEDDE